LGESDKFKIGKIGKLERGKTVLEGGEGFAGAASGKIVIGNFLTIRIFGEEFETGKSFVVVRFGKEIAITFGIPPPYSTPKLVELGQTEPIGGLDNNSGSVGNIDANFDNWGGDKNIDLIALEFLNDLVSGFWFGFAVNQSKLEVGKDNF